jgi:ribonuclease HI
MCSNTKRKTSTLQLPEKHKKKIEVYFDGLCQPYNPAGIACYAFVVKLSEHKLKRQNTIYSEHGLAAEPFTADASNNIAEYVGIIKALKWLILNNYNRIIDNKNNDDNLMTILVKGDSKLAISQIKGDYKVKARRIVPLYREAVSLISEFKYNNIKFMWIPRGMNKEADRLSTLAYNEYLAKNPVFLQKISRHMATEKQIALLRELGITAEKYLSRMEASRLISEILNKT